VEKQCEQFAGLGISFAPWDIFDDTPDRLKIETALEGIPPDDQEVRMKVGAALHHELGEAGFALFDTWTSAWPGYIAAGRAIRGVPATTPESLVDWCLPIATRQTAQRGCWCHYILAAPFNSEKERRPFSMSVPMLRGQCLRPYVICFPWWRSGRGRRLRATKCLRQNSINHRSGVRTLKRCLRGQSRHHSTDDVCSGDAGGNTELLSLLAHPICV
jgi:hypothetical protein